jgi:hypothetical protein
MSIYYFGIRHHGPGCARSLIQALEQLQPDAILIEGPPEADDLLSLINSPEMQPPVALLIYAPAMPQHAVYYPFAEFSPEWQALRFGQKHAVPTRFIDLPQSYRMAQDMTHAAVEQSLSADDESDDESDDDESETSYDSFTEAAESSRSADALTWLAQAAGFSDSETWWDHLVEQRQDSLELFAAIEEMMSVARTELSQTLSRREAQREAYMRQMIRAAGKEGFQRIAVVCGAWHVPALRDMPVLRQDAELLRNLPKAKVCATWTPWTYGRLAFESGYGAGVQAPGWYHHLWNTPEKAGLAWLTDAARLLRKHDLDASSAQVIDALRLSDTLTSLRDRSRAGLGELLEAMQCVLFGDSDAPLRLIQHQLLINDRLGTIPIDAPMLPLPQDVKQLQKRYRMQVRADQSMLELDVRQDAHLEKSVFLHRLSLLGIDWGRTRAVSGKSGSFHEIWALQWEPEFELKLIEANVWGATVEAACNAKLRHLAQQSQQLPELTSLVERMLQADARLSVPFVMARMQALAASTHDAAVLLAALPPLANVLRYGSVRKTDNGSVAQVMDGLVTRACLALPPATKGINAEAAQDLLSKVIAADQAVRLLQHEAYGASWHEALERCANLAGVHALIAGRAVRILTEQGHWNVEHAAQTLSLACSNPINPIATAEWLEGFLSGSGLLLVMNDTLWQILNDWATALPDTAFTELLPLLRRTFSSFEAPERRQLAQRVESGSGQIAARAQPARACDHERAALLLPILQLILTPAGVDEAQT